MLPSLLLRKVLASGMYDAYLHDSPSYSFLCNAVSQFAYDESIKLRDREQGAKLRQTAVQLREEIQKMLDRYAIDPEWIGTTLAGALRCRDETRGRRFHGVYSPHMKNIALRKRALKLWREFAGELEARGM